MDIEAHDAIKVLAHKIFEKFRENDCYPIDSISWNKEELISIEERVHYSRINIFDEYEDVDSFLKDNLVLDIDTMSEYHMYYFVKQHFYILSYDVFDNKLTYRSYLSSQEIAELKKNWQKLKPIYQKWKDLSKVRQDEFMSIWDFIDSELKNSEIV